MVGLFLNALTPGPSPNFGRGAGGEGNQEK